MMSDSEYWQCPKCTGILEKGFQGAAAVIGTATCSHCGAQYSQMEVYDGKWDVEVLDFTPPGRIKKIGYGFQGLERQDRSLDISSIREEFDRQNRMSPASSFGDNEPLWKILSTFFAGFGGLAFLIWLFFFAD
jgi:hypothetical protein